MLCLAAAVVFVLLMESQSMGDGAIRCRCGGLALPDIDYNRKTCRSCGAHHLPY